MNNYIQLKKSNCKNCYKGIRHCPVKSIRFADQQAHIVKEQCILCGECFVACPQNAKQIRNDVEMAKEMIPQGKDCTFISEEKNYIDLFLLTHFKNYIISASTFGWWGAWLSKYDSPNVTIMKNWFNPMGAKSYLNNNDISLDKWEKI